jgi:hypothetical protein
MLAAIVPTAALHRREARTLNGKRELEQATAAGPLRVPVESSAFALVHRVNALTATTGSDRERRDLARYVAEFQFLYNNRLNAVIFAEVIKDV